MQCCCLCSNISSSWKKHRMMFIPLVCDTENGSTWLSLADLYCYEPAKWRPCTLVMYSLDKKPPGSNVSLILPKRSVGRHIQAPFHFSIFFIVRLLKVSLDVAAEDGQGEVMSGVEVCQCPRGYTGSSCEVSSDV